ncbi:DUF1573 domain-containing protein [Flavobacterium sp.]|uniref:DUF1573 domain-containing protein n=1 Tax=Flavobacterium sp. TaxID=239 RepID=UPI0035B2E5BF
MKKLKKYILIILTLFLLLTIAAIITHKEIKSYSKFTKLKIDKNPYTFGTINNNDSITHIFKIKNLTDTLLVIEKVLPSCPCTKVSYNKNKCIKNETVNIIVKFKPTKTQKGEVKTFIYMQCNAEKGVVKLEINGKIK